MDFARFIVKKLLQIFYRVRLVGDQSVFNQEKLLIVANHESFLDGFILGLFLPIKPVFVVHAQVLKNPFFKFILSLGDYLPVEPSHPFAMKTILQLVNSGRPVVIFPEGRITVTGAIMKIYDGPAFVAAKSGATVVPIRFDGTVRSYFSRMSRNFPRKLFPKITLTILKSAYIYFPAEGAAREKRRKASEELRHLMQWMIFSSTNVGTLYQGFVDAIKVFGRKKKIIEDINQEPYSYQYLLKVSLALGRIISKHTEVKEKVGVLMPNLAATVGLVLGASAQARIPAMLNYTAGAEGMRNACVAAGIKLAITSRQFLEKAKLMAVVNALTEVRFIYLEDLKPQFNWRDKLWVMWHLLFPRAAEIPADSTDIAAVMFTSGSEGRPKGVALSHKAMLSNMAQLKAVIDFSVDDKIFNALPIFHAFGLTVGALLPIFAGASLFLYATPLHYRLIPELVYDRNCTILFGTNTFLAKYAHFAHPFDFYRLRYAVTGAEKLADSTRQVWHDKFGVRIFEGYGATEAAPVIAGNTPMAYRVGTVGQFMPGIEYKLMPVEGINEGGLLYVRGSNLMTGYYRYENPGVLQPTESELGKGWYNTGDIVSVDEDGFVHILGRVRRFAKIAGEMISLEVVEQIAQAAAPDKQHAAVAIASENRGEEIVLFTTAHDLSRAILLKAAQALRLPELMVPRRIEFLDVLPLLGTGKTDYVKVKELVVG